MSYEKKLEDFRLPVNFNVYYIVNSENLEDSQDYHSVRKLTEGVFGYEWNSKNLRLLSV